jgi:excisionase family DNA binding protein
MDIKITLTQEQVAQIIRDNKRNSSPDLETYSITGAAKKLQISKSKIHGMINNGEISKIMIGKSPRIHINEINKFLL